MTTRRISSLHAARLANRTDRTIRLWCEQIPGLAERDKIGRWQIDAGQFVRLIEGQARTAALTLDRVKAALSNGEGAR